MRKEGAMVGGVGMLSKSDLSARGSSRYVVQIIVSLESFGYPSLLSAASVLNYVLYIDHLLTHLLSSSFLLFSSMSRNIV